MDIKTKMESGMDGKGNVMDERGSSSILLIIIMVTLLSIGVLSVASAFANHRIALKNADWNKEYYLQDGEYQERIFRIDAIHSKYYKALKVYMAEGTDPGDIPGLSKGDLGVLRVKGDGATFEEKGRLLKLFAAHATASEMGLKSDLGSNMSKTQLELEKAYGYRLPKNNVASDRELEVIVSLYGDGIPILSYREVPADFVYEEVEFTDIKE